MACPIINFPFEETPIQYFESLSKILGISLFLKRDDLFPEAGGGNKARKSQYILEKAKTTGHNAVVTCGDINSNHNRVTALMAAKIGFKAVLVVHNGKLDEEWCSPNILISRIAGAEFVYCSRPDVGLVMDNAMDKLRTEGYNPYYIWGGGHCLEGSYSYYDAVYRFDFDALNFDYVVFASGTGTTHAGIHVGFREHNSDCKVIGISVSRDKQRGINEIFKSVTQLEEFLDLGDIIRISDIKLYDDYLLGGYGYYSHNEMDLIQHIAVSEGLLLDPVYTGKAFYGMKDLIKRGIIQQNSRVLFWHTGGLNNLIGHLSRSGKMGR
jgi:D-cysteine desulfhydrase